MDLNKLSKPAVVSYFDLRYEHKWEKQPFPYPSDAATLLVGSNGDGGKFYFLDDESVWFSRNGNTPEEVELREKPRTIKAWGTVYEKPYKYVNIMDAINAYVSSYEHWESTCKAEYDRVNMLLSSDNSNTIDYNSLVGTVSECDYCGVYEKIYAEFDNNAACKSCAEDIEKIRRSTKR
ncbi:hypothetical protein [Providencia stuartii]|uniref:hypothetical protein n=1 Tax=Providencia stuartii TaxID=588 RepID=UPI0024B0E6A5